MVASEKQLTKIGYLIMETDKADKYTEGKDFMSGYNKAVYIGRKFANLDSIEASNLITDLINKDTSNI